MKTFSFTHVASPVNKVDTQTAENFTIFLIYEKRDILREQQRCTVAHRLHFYVSLSVALNQMRKVAAYHQ